MQAPFDNIVQHLFHQPSLLSVTVDELERMAQQHPYFAAAHFLLLKKMQDESHPEFSTQLHKTTLYFNNPLWLQFLLQPETTTHFRVLKKAPFIDSGIDETAIAGENIASDVPEHSAESFQPQAHAIEDENQAMHHETSLASHGEGSTHTDTPVTPAAGIMDVITAVFNEPEDTDQVVAAPGEVNTAEEGQVDAQAADETWAQPADTLVKDENIIAEHNEATAPPEIIVDETTLLPVETTAIFETSNGDNIFAEKVSEAVIETAEGAENNDDIFKLEGTGAVAETTEIIETENNHDTFEQADTGTVVEAVANNTDDITPLIAEEAATGENNDTVIAAPEPVHEAVATDESSSTVTAMLESADNTETNQQTLETVEEELIPAGSEEPVAAINKEEKPLFKTIIETSAAKDDLLFEPYHTVDYFASQGIKLSKMEANSKDKLGRQLKSFTEWLKSMKKLPQVSIDKILSENEESKVVADAIHSIENKEVITEAMAEVFEKQGLSDKAVGVYQKLSLLNPGKSAYFAAKIDLLKH